MAATEIVALRDAGEIASPPIAECQDRQSLGVAGRSTDPDLVLNSGDGKYQLRRLNPICDASRCNEPAEVEGWTANPVTGQPGSYCGKYCAKHGVNRMATLDHASKFPAWTGYYGERVPA